MAFINVNKVETPDTDKINEALAGTMLLMSSIIYDELINNDLKYVNDHMGILACSLSQIQHYLNCESVKNKEAEDCGRPVSEN